MIKLRLVMLTTTALTLGQWASYPAHADDVRGATATILMAQAATGEGKPEDRAKGRERPGPREQGREAPHGGPAGAPPQRPAPPAAPAPHAAPPARPAPPAAPQHTAPAHPAPPAPPAAVPQHAPPAAARPAQPERPAAPPPRQAAPPPAPAAPKAPAAAPPATGGAPHPSSAYGTPKAAPPPAAQPSAPAQQPALSSRQGGAPPPPAAGGAPHPSSAYGTPKAAPTPPTAAQPAAPTPPQPAPNGRQGSAPTPPPAAGSSTYPSAYGTPKGAPGAAQPAAPAPGSQTAAPQPVKPPQVSAPLPPPPPVADKVIAPGTQQGPRRIEDFRSERRETQQGGRTVITEPGRVIVRDPSGQSFIRHNEEDRFRYGARDIRQERVGNDTRTVVVRPDGTQIITINDRDGRMLRRIRRDQRGQEVIIIDNSYHDRDRGGRGGSIAAGVAAGVVAGAIGGYFVSLPPPRIDIPRNRYIVEAEDAPPEVIYDTLMAPPVERIERAYTLDEVRYSPMVRARMPSIDLDTINFETGSWDIPPDQAAKLQVIADGINRAVQRNPREVFLIEGHTDAVGNDVDNLSLSDRRAQSAAELLTQQFQVPPENLVTQGYGEQNLKVQTDGPSRENRRVTVRRITPLLNGGTASAAPPR